MMSVLEAGKCSGASEIVLLVPDDEQNLMRMEGEEVISES